MAHPTKRQVQARVRFWKKRLKLTDWAFRVEFGKMEDGADAACSAAPEYRHAVLHFCLEQIPAEELDHFVAHEMIHTLVWPLANAGHALAAGDKSKEEWIRTEEDPLFGPLPAAT